MTPHERLFWGAAAVFVAGNLFLLALGVVLL